MKKFFALRAVIIALGIVSAMSALGGCHGSDFYDGWGRTRQDYETNPYADELPKLTDLRIVPCDKKGNVTGEPLLLSPVFSPSVNMYTVVMNDAMLFGGQYKVLPKSKYDISEDAMRFVKYTYVNGPQFAPVTASYVIVTISNGDLKTSYIVSFENPMLEKAKLKSLDFSEGEIVTPVQGFHPDLTSYEVEVPFGLTSVHAIAAPEVNSARVIYSDAPLRLEAGKVNRMMIQVAATGYNTNTYSITFKEGAARDSYIEYFENSIGSLEPDFRRDIYNYTLTIPPSKPLVVRGHMAPGGTMTFNQGIERPNGTRLMQTPKDGTDLLITANNGVGYKSKTYTFSIEIDPTAKFAELETLSVVVSPFTAGAFNKLYKIEDGGRTSEGFVSAIRSYEYFMETGQPISGSLQFSATAPSVMGDNPTITFLPEADAFRRYPFDIRIPERVKVEAAGYMPVVYHVFFNSPDAYKPKALLQGIELLPKPSEGESSKLQLVSPDIFSPENFYYTARAVRGSSVLIKGIPADTQYKLTYSPVNAWDNIQSEATLKIKVDGGSNYQSCEYTITLQITEPQNPLFTRITANNVDVELIENQFYYIIEVPKDENPVGVPISYELAMITDVKTVEWSKDGAVWTEDNTKGGISGIILDPDESELVQIRNTCYDNTQAVYALYLTRQEITDDSLVLRDLCYGDFSLTFEELTTVAGFTPTVHNYSVYVTTGADQKVQGELDPKVLEDNPTAKIVYSRDGLTWSNSPPKVQIDLGDAPVSVYVRVKAGGAHNDYVVVLTRDEALYKIDNALGAGLTINGGNSACKVEIEPKSIWEEGVPAGAVVQIIVKPAPGYKIGINDDGGEVGKPQVFTGKPNFYTPFAPSNIDGKVPTNGDAQTFSFCMPKSDIRIKVDFAELKSVSNYLVNLTASDGSGLKIMERFVPTVISNKVVCINNYVFITPTIPVASTLQKKIFDTGNPYVDVPASELINGIRVDMSVLAARILVLQVVPKNSSLSPRTYSVSIIRIEPSDTLYCIDNSKGLTSTVESDKSLPYAGTPQFWKAPITGWYKFEAYGAKGGFAGSKAGGMGGYSYGELYVLKGQTFGVVVGGEGGHPNHVEGGHSDSYSVPGANYGGRGGGSRDWTNGGGGGGRTEIILSGEVVMIAGGGGGASERGNETDGPGGGGGGGGGDGTNSLGGKQDSSALSSTDSCEGQGGDGYFTRSGDGGGGGGLRGGKTKEGHGGAGGSGYVDANVFSNHGGERGTRDGSGMVVITFNGVER